MFFGIDMKDLKTPLYARECHVLKRLSPCPILSLMTNIYSVNKFYFCFDFQLEVNTSAMHLPGRCRSPADQVTQASSRPRKED